MNIRNAPYTPPGAFVRPTRIVAACVLQDGRIWTGRRHAEIIPVVYKDTGKSVIQDEQGFWTDTGHFASRTAARAIAVRYGQISRETKTIHPDKLFSEDMPNLGDE